jgi:hypothetical protein
MGEGVGSMLLVCEIALWLHAGRLLVSGIFQGKNHYCSLSLITVNGMDYQFHLLQ